MPNSNTFEINCIHKLIYKYLKPDMFSVDPFSNKNRIAKFTNDIDPQFDTGGDKHNCMDALKYLKLLYNNNVDLLLYDPPYSVRQVSECYKKVGLTVNMETTQSSYWTKQKNEIARIIKPDGIVISFGWNSQGIGKVLGFEVMKYNLAVREISLIEYRKGEIKPCNCE